MTKHTDFYSHTAISEEAANLKTAIFAMKWVANNATDDEKFIAELIRSAESLEAQLAQLV